MSLFFYLFNIAISLWHQEFVTTDITAMFVNNQRDIQHRGQFRFLDHCVVLINFM